MATTSAVIEALKYTYGTDKLLYLFNQESPTWKILSKIKKDVGGRGQFLLPVMTQNAGAFTGITEGGALPAALQPDTAEALFRLQEYVGLYDVSWKLIQDSRTSKFAFQQAIQMLEDGLKRRVFRNLNADIIDNGKGRLGVLPAADNTSPITVNALPRVEKGMVVDIMDLSDDDTKLADSVTVTGVDTINRTISVSSNPSGTAAGDYFVIQDTTDLSLNGGIALHMDGLLDAASASNPATVVNGGKFGNIDRTTAGNEYWQGVTLSNGGTNRPFTEDIGLQAQDAVREKGGGQIKAWISNLPILRRYHEVLRAETYAALSSNKAIGGGVGREKMGADSETGETPYDFSGIPWHADPYFAANTIVGIDTNHFFVGVGENDVPRPISEIFENVPFFRQTSNATFEVAWYYQCQLISDNPGAGVSITDIAES